MPASGGASPQLPGRQLPARQAQAEERPPIGPHPRHERRPVMTRPAHSPIDNESWASRQLTITRMLKEFTANTPQAVAAVMAAADGLLITATGLGRDDAEYDASACASLIALATALARRLPSVAGGVAAAVHVLMPRGTFWIKGTRDTGVLGVLVLDGSDPGTVLRSMQDFAARSEHYLAPMPHPGQPRLRPPTAHGT